MLPRIPTPVSASINRSSIWASVSLVEAAAPRPPAPLLPAGSVSVSSVSVLPRGGPFSSRARGDPCVELVTELIDQLRARWCDRLSSGRPSVWPLG